MRRWRRQDDRRAGHRHGEPERRRGGERRERRGGTKVAKGGPVRPVLRRITRRGREAGARADLAERTGERGADLHRPVRGEAELLSEPGERDERKGEAAAVERAHGSGSGRRAEYSTARGRRGNRTG